MSLFSTLSGDMGILVSLVTFRPALITFENHALGQLKAEGFLSNLAASAKKVTLIFGACVRSNPFMCCPLDMALVLDLKPFLNKSWCLGIFPTL